MCPEEGPVTHLPAPEGPAEELGGGEAREECTGEVTAVVT